MRIYPALSLGTATDGNIYHLDFKWYFIQLSVESLLIEMLTVM